MRDFGNRWIVALFAAGFAAFALSKANASPSAGLKAKVKAAMTERNESEGLPEETESAAEETDGAGTRNASGDGALMAALLDGDDAVFSPYGLRDVFSLVYGGGSDEARADMDAFLGFRSKGPEEYRAYDASLGDGPLRVANAAWVDAKAGRNLGAIGTDDVREADFASGEAEDEVNAFVESSTNGKVTDFMEKGELSGASSVFVNAMVFSGKWEAGTYGEDALEWADGTVVEAFRGKAEAAAREMTDGVWILKLPYAGGRYEAVFLYDSDGDPKKGPNPAKWLASLDEEGLAEALGDLGDWKKAKFSIPAFRVETEIDASSALAEAMPAVFAPGAFSGLAEGETASEVKQKAVLEVGAEGTEAAAASAIAMTKSMPMAEKSVEAILDAPFAYAMRDAESGDILFVADVETSGCMTEAKA